MEAKTCLLIMRQLDKGLWCKDILHKHGISVITCSSMFELHEKIQKNFQYAIYIGDELSATDDSDRLDKQGDIINLLSIYGFSEDRNLLRLCAEKPNSVKLLDFITKMCAKSSMIYYDTLWPEIPKEEDLQYFCMVD